MTLLQKKSGNADFNSCQLCSQLKKKEEKQNSQNCLHFLATLWCVNLYFKSIPSYLNDFRLNLPMKVAPKTRRAH